MGTPFQFLAEFLELGEVAEGFRPAGDSPTRIPQHGRGDADGDALPLRIDDVAGPAYDRPAGHEGPLQRTVHLAHAGAEDLGTEPAHRLVAGYAGDLLGGPVERGDDPVLVHGEHPVRDALQYGIRGGRGFPAPLFLHHYASSGGFMVPLSRGLPPASYHNRSIPGRSGGYASRSSAEPSAVGLVSPSEGTSIDSAMTLSSWPSSFVMPPSRSRAMSPAISAIHRGWRCSA
ncbi:MAG: hypothetical protein BWX71_01184 [Deltaproteobacteria bacterium ADurb.Bin072]|nr:MAG: hypothetical protein BWX71_01184 [Deltaproteobacteria bacterium ADurb.Bin072]